jgi:hypothetical protein
MTEIIQSILISKNVNIHDAIKWILQHDYKALKIDITDNFYRFRQVNPNKLKGYHFITKKINKDISFIIAYRPNKYISTTI